MNVSPEAIILMLKSMCKHHSLADVQDGHFQPTISASRAGGGEPHTDVVLRHESVQSGSYKDSRSYSGDRYHSSSVTSRENVRVRGSASATSRIQNNSDDYSPQRQKHEKKPSNSTSAYGDMYISRRPRSSDVSKYEDTTNTTKKRHSHRM